MLAENFKTHLELGIPEKHHRALVLSLCVLESGKIRHIVNYHPFDEAVVDVRYYDGPRLFNMCEWSAFADCGMVCCICGWAEYLSGVTDLDQSLVLHPLIYPKGDYDWDKITPEMAAIVVRHYLTTGEITWSLVTA